MAVVKQVNLTELAREFGKEPETQLREIRLATLRGIIRSIPDLVKKSPVDTGLYAQSWNWDDDGKNISVGNTAPHAPIIEFGARPFTPPIKPLLEWAKRVLKDPSQPPNYSSRVWGLAKYTQDKIARVGMAPKAILQNALPDILESIEREMEKIG